VYVFAARPRWIILHAVVLTVAGLFALAGVWQLDRLSERHERNAFVMKRRQGPAAQLDFVFNRPREVEQAHVLATGRYDTGREVMLLGRGNDGRPGNHVLTPLVMSGGRAVLVDRGWVPVDVDKPRAPQALPPDGLVRVTGVALPSEGSGPLSGGSAREATTAVSRVDVQRIALGLPNRIWPLYLVLQEQEPAQKELPEPAQLASLGEGPHLAYAIQWFLFIPIAVIGYGAILRRESRKVPA
jgi:cytochrome oxidase assembly protein ShyY1